MTTIYMLSGRVRALITRHWKYLLAAVVLIAVIAGIAIRNASNGLEEPVESLRNVTLISVSGHGGGVAVPTADGTSYSIRSEAAGRITRIAAVGTTVAAGDTVAEIESSAQRAALTQAEGAYEAALAASGSQGATQETARRDGVRVWTDATVAAAETVRTTIDGYFGTVRGVQGASGFRLEAFGEARSMNDARTAIEMIFDRWESGGVAPGNASDRLTTLATDLSTIARLVDSIAALIPRQSISDVYTEADRAADASALATARAAISALEQQVDDARTAITNASGTGDASAQAQVKQAYGALEAARAAFAKTRVTSPLAGTVLARSITVGDIITAGADVVIIRGTNGATGSYALPITAIKYTPAGAFVFIVSDGALEAVAVETGLVTAATIEATGLRGDEMIVSDVRGLKHGQRVTVE